MTLQLCVLNLFSKIGDLLNAWGWKKAPLTSFGLHNIWIFEIQVNSDLEIFAGDLPYSFHVENEYTVKLLKDYYNDDGENK